MASTPRIVVGYDGSKCAQQAVAWAARQARLTDANLDVVTAWHWPISSGMLPLGDYMPERDAQTIAAEGAGQADLPPGRVNWHTVEGSPAFQIVEHARGAELLVVGSRGHNDFTDIVLGSVSSHCAHHAPCPVVIIRPQR